MRDNCHGRVFSAEADCGRFNQAVRLLGERGLRPLAVMHHGDSVAFLRTCGLRFDFLFLDSELEIRVPELQAAIDAGSAAPGAIVVFHDTSRLRTFERGQPDARTSQFWAAWQAMRDRGVFGDVFEFPLSRGLLLCRLSERELRGV